MWKRFPALAILASLCLSNSITGAAEPCRDCTPHRVETRSACPQKCCEDARICISIRSRPCFTEQGLQSFAALFSTAAERGVENAMIRALNSTQTAPPCLPGEKKEK